VLVAELVASLVVVKPDVLPIAIGVTVGACASHFARMLIVFLVAAVTVRWRITILDLGVVTCLALDFLRVRMGPFEREVRPFMIEGLLRDRRNVLRSAFVFGVTFLAFPLLFETPVGSLFYLDVLSNVFVAIETEDRLRRFVEPLMAFGTAVFPLGVALDHLAWHEGGFNRVGPGVTREERPEAQDSEWNVAEMRLHRWWSDSIHVDGDDVKDGARRQEIDQWNVKNVPEREETFVCGELGDPLCLPEKPLGEIDSFWSSSPKLRVSLASHDGSEFPGTTESTDTALPAEREQVPPHGYK